MKTPITTNEKVERDREPVLVFDMLKLIGFEVTNRAPFQEKSEAQKFRRGAMFNPPV